MARIDDSCSEHSRCVGAGRRERRAERRNKNGGEIPDFKMKGFEPKSHIELMQKLGMADLKEGRRSPVSGVIFKKRRGAFCLTPSGNILEFL